MAENQTREPWVTSRDVAVVAAFLGFVLLAGPLLIDLAGVFELVVTDPSSVQVLISLAVVLVVLVAALGVVGAWFRKSLLSWLVALSCLALGVRSPNWWTALIAALYVLAAILTTLGRAKGPTT